MCDWLDWIGGKGEHEGGVAWWILEINGLCYRGFPIGDVAIGGVARGWDSRGILECWAYAVTWLWMTS